MKMPSDFGETIRTIRLGRQSIDPAYSLRGLASRVELEPSYLSKIERGLEQPPGESTIRRLANELGHDPDALLALAGKVSSDLLEIIRARPSVVAELLRSVKKTPSKRISEISRQIRDGDW